MSNESGSKTAIIFVGHHNIYHFPAASFHDEIFCKRDPVLNIDSEQWGGSWGLGEQKLIRQMFFCCYVFAPLKKSVPGDVLVGLWSFFQERLKASTWPDCKPQSNTQNQNLAPMRSAGTPISNHRCAEMCRRREEWNPNRCLSCRAKLKRSEPNWSAAKRVASESPAEIPRMFMNWT